MLPPHYQYTDHDIYEPWRPVYSGIILGTSPMSWSTEAGIDQPGRDLMLEKLLTLTRKMHGMGIFPNFRALESDSRMLTLTGGRHMFLH